jgi:hypothetical protein
MSSTKNASSGTTEKVKTYRRFSMRYMLKAFIVTLYDPTFHGQIKTKKLKKLKNKKKGSSSLGLDNSSFSVGSTATFGPVCGPNGCH